MNKKIQYIILNLFRSIIKFSCFLGIFHTVNTLFKQFTEKFNEENRDGWSLVIMLFVMFSVSWCFYHFNRRAKRRFIESFGSSQNPHKKNSPFLVIRSLDFYSDATFCCLLSFISPFVFQYADIEKLFLNLDNNPYGQKNKDFRYSLSLIYELVEEEFKDTFDYKSIGGSMLLGVNGVVVKAHGNSEAYGFSCAMNVAYKMAKANIVQLMKEGLNSNE